MTLTNTLELIEKLMETLHGKQVSACLVAKVIFLHINPETQELQERDYHFPSYSQKNVVDVKEFYERHMEKIAQRLDRFNVNGSHLIIKKIAHIHILLNMLENFTQK